MKPLSAFATAAGANNPTAPAHRIPATAAPIGRLLAEVRLAADARLARDIRDFTREQLLRAGAAHHTVDDAVLLTTELFANAVRHAPDGGVALRLLHDARRRTFTVLVDDTSPLPPTSGGRAAVGPQESGRGLLLVAELALAWGWNPTETGKSVWFSMRTRSPAPDPEESRHA